MKFVIVGYGRVGMRTARILTGEGHDVVVVDNDPKKVDRAEEDGYEAVQGEGDDEDVLAAAGIDGASAIGALTPDLNVNFAACMVGKAHGCRTVLRIDEDYREDIYAKYASDVDEIIYPERLGAAGAKTALLGGDFNVIGDITERLQLSVFRIQEGSPALGKRISEIDIPNAGRIYAHGREQEALSIPLPGTTLEAGDRVAVIAETARVDDVRSALLPAADA